MTTYRLPEGLPDDVREFAEAHPEIMGILIEAHTDKWTAARLLEALKASDYYAETVELEKAWREEGDKLLRWFQDEHMMFDHPPRDTERFFHDETMPKGPGPIRWWQVRRRYRLRRFIRTM